MTHRDAAPKPLRRGATWMGTLFVAVTSAAAGAQAGGTAAQAFPTRPIRIVLPYAAGGASDVLARALAQKLHEHLKQPVFVENRAGANGIVGTDAVAKAAPDGHTLLWTVSTHTILPAMGAKLPYDSERDFAPVTQLTSQAFVLGVYPGLGVKSLPELIALAKAKPGALNFGSGGTGNVTHIGMELLKSMAGIDLVHVPYKGGAPATVAIMSGEVSMLLASPSTTLPQVRAGKIRALAVTSPVRLRAMPDVPTVSEAGVPGYAVITWYGILAPARTPAEITAKLQGEIARAMTSPDINGRVSGDGSDIVAGTPAEFGDLLRSEFAKWAVVIRAAGVRME